MNLSTLENKVSWNSLGMLTRKIIIVNLTVSLIKWGAKTGNINSKFCKSKGFIEGCSHEQ